MYFHDIYTEIFRGEGQCLSWLRKNVYVLKAKCGKMIFVGLYATVATFGLYIILVIYCHYTIAATVSLKLLQKQF